MRGPPERGRVAVGRERRPLVVLSVSAVGVVCADAIEAHRHRRSLRSTGIVVAGREIDGAGHDRKQHQPDESGQQREGARGAAEAASRGRAGIAGFAAS